MEPYPECKGCIEFDGCDYIHEHEIAENCPCLNCIVKMICNNMCSDYERHHDVGQELLSERPAENGG